MISNDDYDRRCAAIRAENERILDEFQSWILGKGLSAATAGRHRRNVEFYVNEFLLHDEPRRAAEGVGAVGEFLGGWFISKALWASETSMRSTAASLKKFYDFMLACGEVDAAAVREMKSEIREEMGLWIETLKAYDDPSVPPEDVWRW